MGRALPGRPPDLPREAITLWVGFSVHTSERATKMGDSAANADHPAPDRLTSLVYAELRRIAEEFMRQERADHTLQPTALVHEAWLKLADQNLVSWQDESHFLAVAATQMRRILVDHARGRNRLKRGGDRRRMLLDSGLAAGAPLFDVLELDDALNALRMRDEQQHRIAVLKLFGGAETKQIALMLDLTEQTVRREWRMACNCLLIQLTGGKP